MPFYIILASHSVMTPEIQFRREYIQFVLTASNDMIVPAVYIINIE